MSCDECLHFSLVSFYALQEFELCFRADEVVLGILRFVVCIAVDVVCQEAHGLHIGEERSGVGQVLDFKRREEDAGALQVALGKGLEDLHV